MNAPARESLYLIQQEELGLIDALEACETDEQAKAIIADALAQNELKAIEKLEAYARVIRSKEAMAKAKKAEADLLSESAKADKDVAKRLKGAVLDWLLLHETPRLQAGVFTLCKTVNGGESPLDITVEPEQLPEEYRIVEYKADTEAIRAALDEGADIVGVSYGPRGIHLRIR